MYKLRPLNIDIAVLYTRRLTDGKNRFENNLYRFKYLKSREKSVEFTLPKFNYYFRFYPLPIGNWNCLLVFTCQNIELYDDTAYYTRVIFIPIYSRGS